MQLGMIGLGRMGGNIVRRLMRHGHTSVVFDANPDSVKQLAQEGATPSDSLAHLVSQLQAPRAVWVMLPAGEITAATIHTLSTLLEAGDILIDGGNSNFQDDVRHAQPGVGGRAHQGHAIEVRLCAEDADFHPHTGRVARFVSPPATAFERAGLRFDHALADGTEVSPHYDAMLGKLIAHAPTRDEAIARLRMGLAQTELLGLPTNRDFLSACLDHPVFRAGDARIPFLAEAGEAIRERLRQQERRRQTGWCSRGATRW